MSKSYDRPITLQKIDETAETWNDVYTLHSRVNKTSKDKEYTNAGSQRSNRSLTFEVRYFKDLEDVAYNTQMYRIIFEGIPFNIVDYDDYMLSHKTIRLQGESY